MNDKVVVTLEFTESEKTGFKFVDCIAEIIGTERDKGTDKYGDETYRCDYLAGLIGGAYQVNRRGRNFHFGPEQMLKAVDAAIDAIEFPPEYVI